MAKSKEEQALAEIERSAERKLKEQQKQSLMAQGYEETKAQLAKLRKAAGQPNKAQIGAMAVGAGSGLVVGKFLQDGVEFLTRNMVVADATTKEIKNAPLRTIVARGLLPVIGFGGAYLAGNKIKDGATAAFVSGALTGVGGSSVVVQLTRGLVAEAPKDTGAGTAAP